MNVFAEICRGLREGKTLHLGTIIRVSGSTPAPIHSRMLVRDDGGLVASGTVGGGCLDGAVLRTVRKGMPEGAVSVERFNLTDELGETEFTCGGTVEILIERLSPADLPLYERIAGELEAGRDCLLRTAAGSGTAAIRVLETNAGHPPPAAALHPGAAGEIVQLIEADPPLVVFGGGHVGRAVASYAAQAGFSVTVVDDRPEFADPARFPGARAAACLPFDGAPGAAGVTDRTFVVIVTRGHRHDEVILEQCLGRSPRYLGMIGSRRKVKVTFDRLRGRGVAEAALSAVRAPVGLPIGARSAEEIGISIVAELIAVRRGGATGGS